MTSIFEAFKLGDVHGKFGVGLGLAIASRAAKLLGAKLTVQSKVGTGSTFRISPFAALQNLSREQIGPTTTMPSLATRHPPQLKSTASAIAEESLLFQAMKNGDFAAFPPCKTFIPPRSAQRAS